VEAERRRLKEWFESEAPKNAQLVAANADYASRLATYEQTLKDLGLEDGDLGRPTSRGANPSVARKDELEELKRELKQEFDQRINVIDQAFPALMGELSNIMQKTIKEGYSIDPRDVIQYAGENRVTPLQAFESLTQSERAKRAEESAKANEEKWKEIGRREALSKLPSPAYLKPTGPSVVDNLSNKDFASDSRGRVNEAVRDYLEGDFGKSSGSGLV
jgi:hypothetical protein